MKMIELKKGQVVSLKISFNGTMKGIVMKQTQKRKYTDIEANGYGIRISTSFIDKILNEEKS